MDKKQDNDLPNIGYLFHYPKLDHPADKFRLDIFISSIPTEKHFDVESARFHVRNPELGIENMTVSHPWSNPQKVRVCAGLVILEDRFGEKVEAFAFGGQLSIEVKELQTVCILVSSAPILKITSSSPQQKLFADEFEILLAEQRAKYPDHFKFEQHLCDIDPFTLYLACLKKLVTKFEELPHKDDRYHQFLFFLHSQMHRLDSAGMLSGYTLDLDNIFNT
jgi:hypothetical protein